MTKKQQQQKNQPEKQNEPIITPSGVPVTTLPIVCNIESAIQLWMGRPGVGKTSTAASLLEVAKEYEINSINPFFLLFEPGSTGVTIQGSSIVCPKCKGKKEKQPCIECNNTNIVRYIIPTYAETEKWFKWIITTPFNPIVIDTVDGLYNVVLDKVCEDLGVVDPTLASQGIAWRIIYAYMRDLMNILLTAENKKGIIMIAHVAMQKKRVKGGEINVATLNLGGKVADYLNQIADLTLYFDVVPDGESNKHILISQALGHVEAKDRWGLMKEPEINLGKSAKEAAETLLVKFGYLEEA